MSKDQIDALSNALVHEAERILADGEALMLTEFAITGACTVILHAIKTGLLVPGPNWTDDSEPPDPQQE